MGRNTAIAWYADVAAASPTKTVVFSYDEVGNLTGYNDATTSASYVYDANNNKVNETVNYGTFQKSLTYTYAPNGLKESFTGPDGVVVRYGYDANNQLNSVQLPIGTIITNSFDWMAPTKWTFPGGVTQARQYDPLLRPIDISVKDQASNTLLDYVYAYDDAGNIDTKQSEHGLYDYGYDSLDRVTQADNPTLPNEVYAYDGVGNRVTDNNRPGAWNYNNDNQLTGIGSQDSFKYDANGSLIQKTDNGVTTEYQYNLESRLTGITSNGSTVASYYYDPFGRRLWKEAGGQRTYFLYAEEGLIAEFDSTGTNIRQYGYKPDSLWGTDPIFQKTGGQYYFYQNDHLGTPQKLVQANGAVVWSAKYQSFGDVQVDASSSVENPLRFPGQYFDKETGLHYNYFRYYDPRTGRYIQLDPIGLNGGTNTYLYVYANPNIYYDPYGLWAWADPLPQNWVDTAAGFGDGLTGGLTDWLRDQIGANGAVNKCSSSYSDSQTAGAIGSLGFGVGRLAYAGLAKGYSVTASSGAAASAFRTRLRVAFGGGKSLRPPNLSKYPTDKALREAAGRTNPYANAAGAAAAAAGANGLAGGDECGCSQ